MNRKTISEKCPDCRTEQNMEERSQKRREKLAIILLVTAAAMLFLGIFLGNASGDPRSALYLISVFGLFVGFASAGLGRSAKKMKDYFRIKAGGDR